MDEEFKSKDKEQYDFAFSHPKENLYKVFGTTKWMRILSPSMRNVPFTGLEWAFLMRDLGYN